jgi:hypothetical protein
MFRTGADQAATIHTVTLGNQEILNFNGKELLAGKAPSSSKVNRRGFARCGVHTSQGRAIAL